MVVYERGPGRELAVRRSKSDRPKSLGAVAARAGMLGILG
jgi:hypothetical protein